MSNYWRMQKLMKSDSFVNLACKHPDLVLFADDVVSLVSSDCDLPRAAWSCGSNSEKEGRKKNTKNVGLLNSGERSCDCADSQSEIKLPFFCRRRGTVLGWLQIKALNLLLRLLSDPFTCGHTLWVVTEKRKRKIADTSGSRWGSSTGWPTSL